MHYSIALVSLVASAYATSYINIEVGNDLIDATDSFRRSHGNENNRLRHGNQRGDRKHYGRGQNRHNYEVLNVMDMMFGSKRYECATEARTEKQEEEAARHCCREIGGKLLDNGSRCEFLHTKKNPQREWRKCTLRERGIIAADCFHQGRENDNNRQSHRGGRRQDNRRGYIISLNNEEKQSCDITIPVGPLEKKDIGECCTEVGGTPNIQAESCIVADGQHAKDFTQCVTMNVGIPQEDVDCEPARLE